MVRFFCNPHDNTNDNTRSLSNSSLPNMSQHNQNIVQFIILTTVLIIEVIFCAYLYSVYENMVLLLLNIPFIILVIYLILFHEFNSDIILYDKFNIIINIMSVVILTQNVTPDIIYITVLGLAFSVGCQIISPYKTFNISYLLFVLHIMLFTFSILMHVGHTIKKYKLKKERRSKKKKVKQNSDSDSDSD